MRSTFLEGYLNYVEPTGSGEYKTVVWRVVQIIRRWFLVEFEFLGVFEKIFPYTFNNKEFLEGISEEMYTACKKVLLTLLGCTVVDLVRTGAWIYVVSCGRLLSWWEKFTYHISFAFYLEGIGKDYLTDFYFLLN